MVVSRDCSRLRLMKHLVQLVVVFVLVTVVVGIVFVGVVDKVKEDVCL